MTTTTTTTITFEGVTATIAEWGTIRATIYTTQDGTKYIDGLDSYHTYPTFLRACAAEGKENGSRVIAWMLTEMQRMNEERTRATALAREAEALQSLAGAIRESSDESALKRILSQVSERTQYAIKQQLKKH